MLVSKGGRLCNGRRFSTFSLASFDWTHNRNSWDVSYTVVKPDTGLSTNKTFVLFPSITLLSTKEEWRHTADFLSKIGHESVIFDWPGWHKQNIPMNWSLEDNVRDGSLVSAFSDFAYNSLKHVHSKYRNSEIHVVCVGGNGTVHAYDAMQKLSFENCSFASLTSFCPTWRFYLPRWVPDGFSRKLARRQRIADWFLSNWFVRSKLGFRLYKSKLGLAKLTKRFYEEKLQFAPELLEAKREVIERDRPLSLDAAMISGHFDVAKSTSEFAAILFPRNPVAANDDDDNDDDDILGIHVPKWAAAQPAVETPSAGRIHFIVPQDVCSADRKELDCVLSSRGANSSLREIPGKIFAHEEYPAAAAEILDSLVQIP